MHKLIRAMILAGVIFSFALALIAPAVATPPGVCGPLDSGKIDITTEITEITITAPDGFLIDEFCVKAGSANQGLGPEYYEVDPPVKTLTVWHSSGKDLSHYSFGWTPVETTTTTTTQPVETTTTTTQPVETTTTTTQPVETTTTTTQPVETTTTTTQPVETTTTTTQPVETTTTTTQPDSTTTTTQPEGTTTTTIPEGTTTTTIPAEPECDEDHPTWNEETQDCRLPFTDRLEMKQIALIAALSLLTGYVLVQAVDRARIRRTA